MKEEILELRALVDDLVARVSELEGIHDRHKGGPTKKVFTKEEIMQLERDIKEAKKNAAPAANG